ncbi:MAG: CMP/dCMP kinase, partial [Acidimicrobiia bacterium]|nr:CMP/dCMP kinase [Acidimicrobiia bacterium]
MFVVALDGPAGTGKSTVARALATRLGLPHLDTGAMYRAVTWAALRDGLSLDDSSALTELAERTKLQVEPEAVLVDGVDVTSAIRGPEVTGAVSAVSAVDGVRKELVDRQREWVVSHGGAVAEGRDIGTVVFPHADLKVYLTASPEVRAARRAAEDGLDVEAVASDIRRRDLADSSRANSPLAAAHDALVVDTSELGPDEVVDVLLAQLQMAQRGSGEGFDRSEGVSSSAAGLPGGGSGSARMARVSDRLSAAWDTPKPARATREFYRLGRNLLVLLCTLWLRMRVEGKEKVPKAGGFILAPVHRSNLDTPIAAAVTRRPLRYMGKDSLWKANRFFAWVLSALGGFPVARGTADREALRRCQVILEAGQVLVLFPEGTRKFGPRVEELYDGPAFL